VTGLFIALPIPFHWDPVPTFAFPVPVPEPVGPLHSAPAFHNYSFFPIYSTLLRASSFGFEKASLGGNESDGFMWMSVTPGPFLVHAVRELILKPDLRHVTNYSESISYVRVSLFLKSSSAVRIRKGEVLDISYVMRNLLFT